MREIKYRAWDSANSRFITDGDIYISQNGLVFGGDLGNLPLVDITNYDVVISQYTGLKDKNGKEIYEGDIISTDLSRPFLIVEFRNGAFMYQCHDNDQDYYDHMEPAFTDVVETTKYHEVIGNIYQNSDLLEVTK